MTPTSEGYLWSGTGFVRPETRGRHRALGLEHEGDPKCGMAFSLHIMAGRFSEIDASNHSHGTYNMPKSHSKEPVIEKMCIS